MLKVSRCDLRKKSNNELRALFQQACTERAGTVPTSTKFNNLSAAIQLLTSELDHRGLAP